MNTLKVMPPWSAPAVRYGRIWHISNCREGAQSVITTNTLAPSISTMLERKFFKISKGLHKPKEVLNAEVAKCMVLCARCHSVFHYFFHQEEKGTWDWIQSRPGEVGQIEIWKGLNEDFVSGLPLEIDFGNSVECPLSELLSEPPLRPEDAVEKTDLDNPLLIASQGDLAHQLGLIESPKSLHQFRYRDARRLLMDKMDENHMEFIRDEARHCILNRRLPRRMTRREFAYRLLLLAFHCVLCSGSLPSFWGKIDKHRLVVWLPKSAETLTIRIAKVGHGLRVSSPAWSIQRVLDEAVG